MAFSGRRMSVGEIQMHGRSEAALHRWNLCEDDEAGDELLGQPELTAHGVTVLNAMLPGSAETPRSERRWPSSDHLGDLYSAHLDSPISS